MNKQQFFNAWAPVYDWLVPSVFYQAAHQQMLEHVDLPSQATVLDIGCGTGRLLYRLLERYPNIKGTGIDFSPDMLRQARQNRGDRPQIIFTLGQADQLAFADEQFDAVFCTFSFMHYPDPQQVFSEISRVLQPGGRFYLLDPLLVRRMQALPVSPNGVWFYSATERDRLAQTAHLTAGQHHRIFFVSLLSIFRKD